MAVEQEMAVIYAPEAEELSEFLPDVDCGNCGFATCIAFAEGILDGEAKAENCSELKNEFVDALAAIVDLDKDPIPYNLMMEQVPCEVIEINEPDEHSPLLITCNFQETIRIMKEIFDCTSVSAFLLPTDTHGYSVDNAIYEKMFKPMEIWKAIKENQMESRLDKTTMVIPGLAERERNAIRQLTRWEVSVGPISGFLAPLFVLKNT
ncbi:MAG: hypothetical protein HN416_10380 [Nitrospina sp.]|nr:hypothetical protein [Nitrospina sp.]